MQKNMAVCRKALRPYWRINWKNSLHPWWQALACCLLGCTATDTIAGTYTAEWSNAFYTTRDTLQLRPLNGQLYYEIIRRSMATGQGQPRYRLQQWTGVYQPGDHSIRINSNGRLLLLKTGRLIMGTTTYKKL